MEKAEHSAGTGFTPEWFNDENFWQRFAPIMFDDRHWEEVPSVADGITRLAKLPLYGDAAPRNAPRCLDLCCGFGRIGLELARRGFSVSGVDITETYLETGRRDAAAENLDVTFIKADARSFCQKEAFDIALNCYISFGYFADRAGDRRLVQNAYDSLTSGGTFFIETQGKETAARDFTPGEWFFRAGFYVLTSYRVVDSWDALENTWRLFDDNGASAEKTFTCRLYSASELRSLLLETGFAAVEIYGDWDESPYDEKAKKLIVLGRKR
ncbi:MAG: class I SAM-dependent methyltransferase [Treponema sp.]|jgi:SAM-dependent methyltransferase|nr:class I SAM-dependent methyltransferase [Treponema sp.]